MAKKVIGVMGSSSGAIPPNALELAFQVGRTIAVRGAHLLTGGTLGVPERAVDGCHQGGGFALAVSPASDLTEHVERYRLSQRSDAYIFTGMGDMGRNFINIRSCDAVVFVCGGLGTLSEFSTAYAEGKLIGVLTNSGGISGEARNILDVAGKPPKNKVLYSTDPGVLVADLLAELERRA